MSDLMMEIGTAANLAGIETLEKSLDALKKLARQAAEEVEGIGGENGKPSPFEVPDDGIGGRGGREIISTLGLISSKAQQTGAVMISSLTLGSGFNRGVFRSLMSGFGAGGLAAGIMTYGIMESSSATDQLNKKLINLNLDPKFAQEMIHISKLMKGTEDDAFHLQKTLKNLHIKQEKMFDFGMVTELAKVTGRDAAGLFSPSDAQERTSNLRQFMSTLDSETQDAVAQVMGLSETNLMMLRATNAEFDAMRKKARQVALSISDRDLKAAEKLEDSLANAGAAWSQLMQPLNTAGMENLAILTESAAKSALEFSQAIKDNKSKSFNEKGIMDMIIDAGEFMVDNAPSPKNISSIIDMAKKSLASDQAAIDRGELPKALQQKPSNITISSPITINMQPSARPQDVAAEVKKTVSLELTNWAASVTSGGF